MKCLMILIGALALGCAGFTGTSAEEHYDHEVAQVSASTDKCVAKAKSSFQTHKSNCFLVYAIDACLTQAHRSLIVATIHRYPNNQYVLQDADRALDEILRNESRASEEFSVCYDAEVGG